MYATPQQTKPLATLREMARQLRVPSSWLRSQAEQGQVPALQAGKRWLFDREATTAAVSEMARSGEVSK